MRTQIPGKQILDEDVDTEDLKDGAVTDQKLSPTGVSSGSYTKVTVNDRGRVIAAESPTTLAGYGITNGFSAEIANQIPWITVDLGQFDDPETPIPPDASFRILRANPNELTIVDGGPLAPLTLGIAPNPIIPGTAGMRIPYGTTAQRPATSGEESEGLLRYNETLEEIETFAANEWTSLVHSTDKRLRTLNTLVVQKDPGIGQFSSIKAAIESITDAAIENRYVIRVCGGTYFEDPIQMKRYVAVVGDSAVAVIIKANNQNADLISGYNDSAIERVTLTGATGTNFSALRFSDATENETTRAFVAGDIRFGNNYRAVTVTSSSNATTIYLSNVQFGGSQSYQCGIHVESTNGATARVLVRSSTTRGAVDPLPNHFGRVIGVGAELFVNACQFRTSISSPAGIGFAIRDGAILRIIGTTLRGFAKAIEIENAGAAPKLYAYNVGLESNNIDLDILHPSTTGIFSGNAERSKVFSVAPAVSIMYLDPVVPGVNIVGNLHLGHSQDGMTDVTDLILETPTIGLLSGGDVTSVGGLSVSVAAGVGFVDKDGYTTRVEWPITPLTLPANSSPYIYVTKNGVITFSDTAPEELTNILLARTQTNATTVVTIGMISTKIHHHGNHLEEYLRDVVGPVYVSGSIVTENATTPRAIDITAGKWNWGTLQRNPAAKTAPTIVDIHRTAGATATTPRATIPNDTIDDGTNLVAMTAGYYTKHAVYSSAEGAYQTVFLAHGQAEYATLDEARAAPLPVPRIAADTTPQIAAIVVQQGTDSLIEIQDIREMFFRSVSSGAAGGTSDHGDLIGLGDDDHQQYILANGSRAFTGDVSLSDHDITDVGLINGFDLSTMAARYAPNGLDPIPTGPAISLSNATTNTEGIESLLARSDHTHEITGFQPLSGELSALSSISTSGVLVHLEPNTWLTRNIVSTGNALAITNPNGVAGNIDINFIPVGTPGTYHTVTTDENGSVIAGTQQVPFSALTGLPTTLAGHGITNGQPLDADLTALASAAGTGFYIRTGDGTSVTRALIAPPAGLTITNADGVSAAPTFALANDLAALEALSTNGIPVRSGTDTWVIRSLTAPAAGLTISNNTGVAGNPTFALANDLAAVEGIATAGLVVRTTAGATSTWVTRQVTSTTLAITNPTGAGGDLTINLSTAGTPGTYRSVTTDTYGRVTAGTNPTTLAGYGITDAVTVSQLGVNNGVATLDNNGKLTFSQLPATAIADTFVIGAEAAMLALTAEVGDVAVRTDLNRTFILRGADPTVLANWQELLSPTDAVSSVNGQTGVVNLSFVTSVGATQPGAGLTISGGPITSTGTLTFALSNDLAAVESLAGTGFAVRTGTDTWAQRTFSSANAGLTITNGDGIAGNVVITLPTVGTAGTFKIVSTDAYGRITSGSNPTTLAGFGITDAQPLDADLTALANLATTGLYVNTGAGTAAARTLTAGAGISISNGSGVAGNPTITNTGVIGVTATSPPAGMTIIGGGTGTNPTFSFALVNDLGALEGLASTGFAVRTATDTWAQRSIAVGAGLSIANANGVSGNPTISLDGQNTAATGLLSSWTLLSGTRYYADFAHNLGTNNVVITLYDSSTNEVITADAIVLTNTNTVRVTVVGNSRSLRIVVVANGMAINTGTQSAGTVTTASDGVNVSTAASRLNFVGQAVTVTDAGGGTTNVSVGSRYVYFAASLDSPVNADWAINALAPTIADPSFNSLTARQFSNSAEQGVGCMISIPGNASQATFRFRGRPLAAIAGATNVVAFRVYARWIGGTMIAGPAGWQSVKEIGEILVPASSTQIIYSGFTISLSTLGLSAGGLYQIELTRRVSGTTGTNLATSYLLYELTMELS